MVRIPSLNAVVAVPSDDEGPTFNAPWEAKAFAIVVELYQEGYYSWSEWTEYLSQEIAAAKISAQPERPYYEHWLAACEKLLAAKNLVTPNQLADRKAILMLSGSDPERSHHHR